MRFQFKFLPMVSSTYGDSWASSSRPSPYDENPKGKGKSKGKGKRKTKVSMCKRGFHRNYVEEGLPTQLVAQFASTTILKVVTELNLAVLVHEVFTYVASVSRLIHLQETTIPRASHENPDFRDFVH